MDQTLRILYDSNLVGLFFWNSDGQITRANDAFLKMVGYSPQDLAEGRVNWRRMTPPEYEELTRQRHAQLVQTCVCPPYEKEYIRKDGGRVPILVGVALFEGSRDNGICFVIDATDRKLAQDALREREARLKSLIENMPFDVWARDAEGRAIMQNRPSREMWGEMVGLRIEEQTVSDQVREEWLETNRRALAGEVVCHEKQYLRDGQWRSYYSIVAPVWEGAKVTGLVGANIDITDQQRDAQCLREAEHRYRLLFELSPYGLIVVDPATVAFVEFNTVAHRQLGYTREEFARLNVNDVEVLENQEQTLARCRRLIENNAEETFETRHRTRTGDIRDTLVTVRPLMIGGRMLLHSIQHDITERNRLKAQLWQSQKMEAIGLLAGGIAHDFNNLLAVIGGYSEALMRRLAENDPLRTHAAEIHAAAERGTALTRQLLAFSRHQAATPELLDLGKIVTRMHDMLRRVISKSIVIEIKVACRLPSIKADPGQMEQVVMNLALNARDAMPAGGTLSIATSLARLSGEAAEVAGVPAGEYLKLSVSDTGAGMDEETRARLFEPFFTTKAAQGGTGLGLSIVYGIARQHGGNVTVHSQLGRGSCFEVFLPRASDKPGGRRQ